MRPYLLFASFALFICACMGQKDPKAVKVGVHANWAATPLALEAAEFIWEKDPSGFFEYAEASMKAGTSDADAVELASGTMSGLRRGLFEFAMHIRQLSPRIEMMRQAALSTIPTAARSKACFVLLDGNSLYSTVQEVSEAINRLPLEEKTAPEHNAADHPFPGNTNPKAPTVYLHGNIAATPQEAGELSAIHDMLSDLAKSGKIRYVFRHHIPDGGSFRPLDMVGYGVELAIKKMEYKAVDDREVKDSIFASVTTCPSKSLTNAQLQSPGQGNSGKRSR